MFILPKVKKKLTGLVNCKSIKKVVAGAVLTAGIFIGGATLPAHSEAAAPSLNMQPSSQIGALVLTPPSNDVGRLAWHTSHASHSSHSSHTSHYSHYSSRY